MCAWGDTHTHSTYTQNSNDKLPYRMNHIHSLKSVFGRWKKKKSVAPSYGYYCMCVLYTFCLCLCATDFHFLPSTVFDCVSDYFGIACWCLGSVCSLIICVIHHIVLWIVQLQIATQIAMLNWRSVISVIPTFDIMLRSTKLIHASIVVGTLQSVHVNIVRRSMPICRRPMNLLLSAMILKMV